MTMTLLDPIGASLSLIATYYFTKASIRAWPLSIAAILINSILYWQKGIYGHLGLEMVYLLTTLYGWLYWQSKQAIKPRAITNMPKSLLLYAVPLLGIAIFVLSYLLKTTLGSQVPYWDASTTLLALCAQLMLCQKWIECWLLWFVVDALVVLLHWYKGIPFHSFIHFIYLGFAMSGYLKWKRLMSKESNLASQQAILEQI